MEKSKPPNQEVVGAQLTEEISQFEQIPLGEGAATCQVCGSSLRDSDGVVVYVFRPAGEVMFQVGNVVCSDGDHALPEEYTLGVRELLVEGRIGVCSDEVTQSSWRVLVEPKVLAVSAAATKSVRLVPDGGPSANGASDVRGAETHEASAEVSLVGAQRRAGRPDGDVVRGLFWGEQR